MCVCVGVETRSISKYLHFVYYKHASLELAVMANNIFFACGDLEILFFCCLHFIKCLFSCKICLVNITVLFFDKLGIG